MASSSPSSSKWFDLGVELKKGTSVDQVREWQVSDAYVVSISLIHLIYQGPRIESSIRSIRISDCRLE